MGEIVSSTYPEARTPARLRWLLVRERPPRWQVVVTWLAVVLRLAYVASLYLLSQQLWLSSFMGTEMRADAAINFLAAAGMAAGMLLQRPAMVVVAGAVALLALFQPISGAGWQSALLLPWATSLTAIAVLSAAVRISREIGFGAAALLVPYAVALVAAKGWAAIDFAIAASATVLMLSVTDVLWRRFRGGPLIRLEA